jgi:hypothetical protein
METVHIHHAMRVMFTETRCQNRRMSKAYERLVQTSEVFIGVAMIRSMLKRLAKEV